MWLLPSKGRRKLCQEALDACSDSGMTSLGVLFVDTTVDEYAGIRLPPNWTVHYCPEGGSLTASMQWAFKEYPSERHYGWLADDVRPRTQGWDKLLEEAAGDWDFACANDLWLGGGTLIQQGRDMTSGLCWGGELVRAVGWWGFPEVIQAGIDTAWVRIIAALGSYRYLPDVIVEHLNWRTGKRDKDDTDAWLPHVHEDIRIV